MSMSGTFLNLAKKILQVVCWLFLARCSLKIILARSNKRRGGTVGQSEGKPLCDSANTAKQAQQAAGQLQEANALDFHCIFIYYVCFVFENGGGFAKRFPR